jgi:hypothetical protein
MHSVSVPYDVSIAAQEGLKHITARSMSGTGTLALQKPGARPNNAWHIRSQWRRARQVKNYFTALTAVVTAHLPPEVRQQLWRIWQPLRDIETGISHQRAPVIGNFQHVIASVRTWDTTQHAACCCGRALAASRVKTCLRRRELQLDGKCLCLGWWQLCHTGHEGQQPFLLLFSAGSTST